MILEDYSPAGLVVLAVGVCVLCGALFDWKVCMQGPRAQRLRAWWGHSAARVVHGVFGGILLILGLVLSLSD